MINKIDVLYIQLAYMQVTEKMQVGFTTKLNQKGDLGHFACVESTLWIRTKTRKEERKFWYLKFSGSKNTLVFMFEHFCKVSCYLNIFPVLK